MVKIAGTTPIDVGEVIKCVSCEKGMMHSGGITFYEVTVRQCVIDASNIQRMHGLEQMMNGNVGLARVFSPNNTIGHRLGDPERSWFCMECAMQPMAPVVTLFEGA